jgi:hypothetical protein
MGVATFKTSKQILVEMKGISVDTAELKRLLKQCFAGQKAGEIT